MNRQRISLLLILLFIVGIVSAVPTTLPATSVGNNNITFNGNGVVSAKGWFQWGMASGNSWAKTPNITASGGVITYTLKGTPVFGCTTYYYRACDNTGCGSEVNLMTLEVTPLPSTTYGIYAQNITENAFSPANAFWNSLRPYTSVTGDTVFYGMIFAMIFVGLWLRTRGTMVANILGMLCIALFASTAVGLQLGLPPEFLAVGQALMYISLAGAFVSFTFK